MEQDAGSNRGVALRQVLPEADIFGADDVWVMRCTSDSRLCKPGDVFVALAGRQFDGHEFVAEAVARGARAVVVSRPVAGCTVPVVYVDDPRWAFGRLCQALAGEPSRQMKTIGITGTNGKTTTSWLAAAVLEAGGYASGVSSTVGCFDGREAASTPWTTPPADVLAGWLSRCRANGCTHAVLETSSQALAEQRVAGIEFDVACFTNVGHDHLDYHGSRRAYRAAKARLLRHLAAEGFAVFNVDDPGAARLLPLAEGPVLSVGIDTPAELTAVPLESYRSEQTFLLVGGSESVPVRTRLVGRHNLSNCLMAAAVGVVYGLPLATIASGLESVDYVPGRLERIECGQPFGVFVDYAHTPEALASVLDTLRELASGRLICVFGAGGNRDILKRPKMAQAVEQRADLLVLTSDNPRHEPVADIFSGLLSGCQRPAAARVIVDRRDAIGWALAEAQPGDCVLIAGKGHETWQQVGDRRIACDDRELAREWLYRQYLDELPHAA